MDTSWDIGGKSPYGIAKKTGERIQENERIWASGHVEDLSNSLAAILVKNLVQDCRWKNDGNFGKYNVDYECEILWNEMWNYVWKSITYVNHYRDTDRHIIQS